MWPKNHLCEKKFNHKHQFEIIHLNYDSRRSLFIEIIRNVVKKVEETGSIADTRSRVRHHGVRLDKNIVGVGDSVADDPKLSFTLFVTAIFGTQELNS